MAESPKPPAEPKKPSPAAPTAKPPVDTNARPPTAPIGVGYALDGIETTDLEKRNLGSAKNG